MNLLEKEKISKEEDHPGAQEHRKEPEEIPGLLQRETLRFSHVDYAWALNKLRRSERNPTLEAIHREIQDRYEGGRELGQDQSESSFRAPWRPWGSVQSTECPEEFPSWSKELPASQVGKGGGVGREKILELEEQLIRKSIRIRELEKKLQSGGEESQGLLKLQQQLLTVSEEVELLRRTEEELRVELETVHEELENRKNWEVEFGEWKVRIKEREKTISELEQQVEELEVDAILRDSLDQVIREQQISLETAARRVEALECELENNSRKSSTNERLQSRVAALEATEARLAEEISRLQNQCREAEQHRQAAETSAHALKETREVLEKRIRDLEERLNRSKRNF